MRQKQFLNYYLTLVEYLDALLRGALVLLMAVMVINVLWQIATRFLLNDPSSFTEELARFLLLWIGILGACHAYRVGAHLGLDIIASRFSAAARLKFDRMASLAVIIFAFCILVIGGGNLTLLTYDLKQTSAAMGLPIYLVYLIMPAAGVLLCLFALASFIGCEPCAEEQ